MNLLDTRSDNTSVKILLDTCSIKRRKGNLNRNNDDDMGLVNKNLISTRQCIEMK